MMRVAHHSNPPPAAPPPAAGARVLGPATAVGRRPGQLERSRGEGAISTRWRQGKTHLGTLYQAGSAKIRLPNSHSPQLEAALVNTAGGLTGGDYLAWCATADDDTRLLLTTPSCERVYRSLGDDAEIAVRMSVGPRAHLYWLPQETILFDGARLQRRLEVDLAANASLTLVESVVLGRQAMGEAARSAHLRDFWRISRQGRLVHAEATRLDSDGADRTCRSLLDGAGAFGTILCIGGEVERRLETVRALIPPTARAGASLIGDRLVVRALAPSSMALRRVLVPMLAELCPAGALPRLWLT